ncbi:exocyst complex component EXO70B1-like, partial [Trifolium medium]|nr:exocyst complex component EXO70B1-like [Trifolium medium]
LMEIGGESFDVTRNSDELTQNGSSLYDSNGEEDEEEIDGDEDVIPVAKAVVDYDVVIDALPPATVNDLREIAKR